MKASEFINFIDYNAHDMNIKGSHVRNKFECIFITSTQNPEQIYGNYNLEHKYEDEDEPNM